jgi:hypothetical protein
VKRVHDDQVLDARARDGRAHGAREIHGLVRLFTVAVVVAATACAPQDERLVATLTSDVVQRDTCRILGDSDRELCTRDESIQRLTVSLIEDAHDRVWLSGIVLEGESDRRVLGTRDSEGGFLFVEKTVETNTTSGCTFTRNLLLSLKFEEGVSEEQAMSDVCSALVGRELRTFTTSLECDDINNPPIEITRINRRRWEPALDCASE